MSRHDVTFCHLGQVCCLMSFLKLTAQLPLKNSPKERNAGHRPVGENEWILVIASLDKIANRPKIYQYSLLVFQLLRFYRFCTGKPRSVVGQSLPLFHSSAQWPLSPLRFRFLPAKPSLGRFWVGKDMENLPIFPSSESPMFDVNVGSGFLMENFRRVHNGKHQPVAS